MRYGRSALLLISIYFFFADTPTRIAIGPVSLNALFSVGIAALLALFSAAMLPKYRALPLGFRVLTAWMPISFALAELSRGPSDTSGGLSIGGIQQFLAWLLFVGSILLLHVTAPDSIGVRRFNRGLILAGCLWAVVAILFLPAEAVPGDPSSMIGPRPLAALLVMSLSLSWAGFSLTRQLIYVASSGLIFIGIVATQSRAATVAAVLSALIIAFADVHLLRPRTWPKLFYAMQFALVAITLAMTYPPLRERLLLLLLLPTAITTHGTEGQAAFITQGRWEAWPALLSHASESPFWGHGIGSSSAYTYSLTGNERFAHPHNEYLRIFHDTGAVGLLCWTAGFAMLWLGAWQAYRQWRGHCSTPRRAVLLSLTGLVPAYMLLFATDNIGFYTFIMVPLGAIAGISLNRSTRFGGTQPAGEKLRAPAGGKPGSDDLCSRGV